MTIDWRAHHAVITEPVSADALQAADPREAWIALQGELVRVGCDRVISSTSPHGVQLEHAVAATDPQPLAALRGRELLAKRGKAWSGAPAPICEDGLIDHLLVQSHELTALLRSIAVVGEALAGHRAS